MSRPLNERQEEPAEAIVARHYERQPRLWQPFAAAPEAPATHYLPRNLR